MSDQIHLSWHALDVLRHLAAPRRRRAGLLLVDHRAARDLIDHGLAVRTGDGLRMHITQAGRDVVALVETLLDPRRVQEVTR